MRTHNNATTEPMAELRAKADRYVNTTTLGRLGWALTAARAKGVLPEAAKRHLAYLFDLGEANSAMKV